MQVQGDLATWLDEAGIDHVRSAPNHPQTQGKIERWHQTLKYLILLEKFYLPGALEKPIAAFVEHYDNQRYHESLGNLTPADVYFARAETILRQRREIKAQTIETRRRACTVRQRHRLNRQRARASVPAQSLVSQII